MLWKWCRLLCISTFEWTGNTRAVFASCRFIFYFVKSFWILHYLPLIVNLFSFEYSVRFNKCSTPSIMREFVMRWTKLIGWWTIKCWLIRPFRFLSMRLEAPPLFLLPRYSHLSAHPTTSELTTLCRRQSLSALFLLRVVRVSITITITLVGNYPECR